MLLIYPMVYYLALDVKIKGAAANSVSLASAIMCRFKSQSIALGFPPYCQNSRLNHCWRKHFVKKLQTHLPNVWVVQPITSPVRWWMGFLKSGPLSASRYLLSPPVPPFSFWPLPHFSRGQNTKNPFLQSFFYSPTPQKYWLFSWWFNLFF